MRREKNGSKIHEKLRSNRIDHLNIINSDENENSRINDSSQLISNKKSNLKIDKSNNIYSYYHPTIK